MIHALGNSPFPLLRSTLILSAVAGFSALLVTLIAPQLSMPAIGAAAACLIGGFIGLLPVWRLATLRIDGAGVGYLLGLMPRAMVAFAAAMFVQHTTAWNMPTFAALLAAFYVVLLASEVVMLTRYLATQQSQRLEPAL